jgi:hypothetical protein
MATQKLQIKNVSTNIILFNYQNASDNVWNYQSQISPGQEKHIWCVENTFSYSGPINGLTVINKTTNVCGITPTPTPTPTQTGTPTPTPTQTVTQTVTPTASVTPTITETTTNTPTPTSTITETPTNTPTPTPTPTNTVTPTTTPLPFNVTLINDSTIASIDDFQDLSGSIPLINLIGSFSVTSGQTLIGYHPSVTDTGPRVTVSGTGSITFNVNFNGFTLVNSTSTLPVNIGVTSGSVPLQVSDTIIVTITDYNP